MILSGLQKTTLLDYPGNVACTVFTGGCNFRCPFCHNATLVLHPGQAENITEEEFFSFLSKRKGILDGVAVTGGEPLLQSDLPDFLRKIKKEGFKVKLDTNGSLPLRLFPILEEHLADYVAMDIKAPWEDYRKVSGVNLDPESVETSLRMLSSSGIPYELRTTVVKGLHTKESLLALAREILPYRPTYFLQGFKDSGDILTEGCDAYTNEEMHLLLDAVRTVLPETALRGID